MKRFLFIPVFIITLIVLMVRPTFAEEEPIDGCDEKDAAIFFVNGIMTTKREAKSNLLELNKALKEKISTGQITQEDFDKLEFDIAYNPSAGLMRDLAETIANKLQDSLDKTLWTLTWEVLLPLPFAFVPEDIKNDIMNKAAAATVGLVINQVDLHRHLTKYLNAFQRGKKVLLVSHSQGNFFATVPGIGYKVRRKRPTVISTYRVSELYQSPTPHMRWRTMAPTPRLTRIG